jgi:hypothetical protein
MGLRAWAGGKCPWELPWMTLAKRTWGLRAGPRTAGSELGEIRIVLGLNSECWGAGAVCGLCGPVSSPVPCSPGRCCLGMWG